MTEQDPILAEGKRVMDETPFAVKRESKRETFTIQNAIEVADIIGPYFLSQLQDSASKNMVITSYEIVKGEGDYQYDVVTQSKGYLTAEELNVEQ